MMQTDAGPQTIPNRIRIRIRILIRIRITIRYFVFELETKGLKIQVK